MYISEVGLKHKSINVMKKRILLYLKSKIPLISKQGISAIRTQSELVIRFLLLAILSDWAIACLWELFRLKNVI